MSELGTISENGGPSTASSSTAPPRRPTRRVAQPPAAPSASSAMASPIPDVKPAPIHPSNPAIDRALALSSFEGSYSTEEFIATLSDQLISTSKATAGAFDPQPFLHTFSPALDSLLSLRAQVAERTKKMETEVRRAEREYGRRLRELDGGFEAIGSSFSSLESKINAVGRTAVRIGEQLEGLHNTRSTAQSTSLLLSYYLSLAHQTSLTVDPNDPGRKETPLEALFATRTSRDGRARLAIILRRLMAVAKDVADNAATALEEEEDEKNKLKRRAEVEKADRVRDEIERYCEKFEKECLRLFDRSYRKGDPRMMAHCAKTLQDFNGGASCVQIYVNQHDFFISHGKVVEEADESDLWDTIGDPDAAAPTSEPGLAALIKEVKITTGQEAQIVKAVFPNPVSVATVFLQRVFAQVLQQHIENLVTRAAGISTLAVLRILHLCHASCVALVEELKPYDQTLAPNSKASGPGPLAAMLDHALEEIFVPWIEGQRYLERESKNLVELYGGLLRSFTRYHETVLKAKPNSILDRVVNQLSTSSPAPTASTTQGAAAAISRYANLFTSSASAAGRSLMSAAESSNNPNAAIVSPVAQKPPLPIPSRMEEGTGLTRSNTVTRTGTPVEEINPADGAVGADVAERMLRWHAEAVGRVVELSLPAEVGKNAFALSKVLAEALGRGYVDIALDSALAKIEQLDTKADLDFSPLLVLRPIDQVTYLWQRYLTTALLPLAATQAQTTVKREMATFNAHGVVRMEGKINALLQKSLDVAVIHLRHLLSKQKKNDYKPSNDEMSFARNQTEPCSLSCDFIEDVLVKIRGSVSGKNAEVLLTELGVAWHSLLLEHYKRWAVNPTGGLMLTKDLALYQETAAHFGIPAVNDRFDMLRQLGNSFIVQPDVLKSYLSESHLGRIELRLLRPYLQQRVDYSSFAKSLDLEGPDPASSSSASSLEDRKAANRLSTISGVAGAGMGKLKGLLKEFENMGDYEPAGGVGAGGSAGARQRAAQPYYTYMPMH